MADERVREAPEQEPQTKSTAATTKSRKPAVLVVGMAGSGKTTFLQRLQADQALSQSSSSSPFVINLDPAVLETPYEANLDIRDTVDYKQVMKQYGLGPNGAIMTCLNLFTTKWDQVLEVLDRKDNDSDCEEKEEEEEKHDCILVDTPGQIEIFTWSASGAIISETLSASRPTLIAYVMDVVRCTESPIAFMSNMLYACSIMYKTGLPIILVLNKTDLQSSEDILEWLQDYYAFQEALQAKHHDSYMASMMQSMGLVLEEFYANIKAVSVSSFSGDGLDDFWTLVHDTAASNHDEDDDGSDMLSELCIKD